MSDPVPRGNASDLPPGRRREYRLIDGLLESAPRRGAALLVYGEPGIGKSTLLEYTAADRAGVRVLRSRGAGSEALIPYAVLADLLLPLRPHFDRLPPRQRRALEACFALSDADDADPYAVCAGALRVLSAAGRTEPVVVVVDDVHRVDPASRRVLQFVARRVAAEPVVLVMAAGEGLERQDGWEGVPHLVLDPLDEDASWEVLRRHAPDLSALPADRIVALSRGNPLVLVEYAKVLNQAPGSGVPSWDEAWPAPGPRVEQAWQRLLRGLPAPTRQALLYLATGMSTDMAALERVLDLAGLSLGALDAAEEAGLVRAVAGAYELRHPVLRPLVLGRCPTTERLRAYRVWAEASSGELRTWYLAAAVAGPDAILAAALDDTARREEGRGALGRAARAWYRAADLSDTGPHRAVRLLHAAADALHSGDTGNASRWCDQALRWSTDPALTADIELLRGQACGRLGMPGRALQLLTAAARAVEPVDRARACALHGAAAGPALMDGRITAATTAAARCSDLAGPVPELRRLAAAVSGVTHAWAGRVSEARALLLPAARTHQPRGKRLPEEGFLVTQIGMALSWVEEDDAAREVLDFVIDRARRDDVRSLLPPALVNRCAMESWRDWNAARAFGDEALRWSRKLGHVATTGYALTLLARLGGLRGDRTAAEELVAQYEQRCGRAIRSLDVFAEAALGSAALAVGDLRSCQARLERAFTLAAETGLTNPNLLSFVADLAEAHIRAGNRRRATELTIWLQERAGATALAWPAAAHARCRAMLAESADRAEEWLTVAEQYHACRDMPFELARTRLAAGAVLRRLRRPAAAREPLRSAHRAFAVLGAASWQVRAGAELAATGHEAPGSLRVELLTAQELQVARAIGKGLSNAEAATALFLSRKTVEAHLTRIYRKLDLRSRTDLARHLALAGVEC
ncbi:LuxR family transcriptional regulator [Streptomyces shaanxiensis]|uniref:LuxR family transcriptional regulator n=1 Tax=Streptomyces shaanxiensis TaxID=653357 RepID=A0ABP7UGZ4_9ACTN